jgi:hypothetical protein
MGRKSKLTIKQRRKEQKKLRESGITFGIKQNLRNIEPPM